MAMVKQAFTHHLEETNKHVTRLDEVFTKLNEDPKGETCEAMKGLVKEGEEFIHAKAEPEVRDAGLIGAAQRVEHDEMAGYGTTTDRGGSNMPSAVLGPSAP
jgi:ferritin-like metal-binding protein YciE